MKRILKGLSAVLIAAVVLVSFNAKDAGAAAKYGTKSHELQLNSYNFGDVELSKTYTMAKGNMIVKMPNMGTHSFKGGTDPTVIIRLIKKSSGKIIRTQYVSGVGELNGKTYNFAVPIKGKYYFKITGNIDQMKPKTWKYTGTFY